MKPLQQDSEHRPGACAPGGDFLRCGESSGFHTRWAHRLKVYVPMCAFACMFWASPAFAQSDPDFAKANEEFAQGHFKEAIAGYETLIHQGQRNANLFYDLGNAYFRARDFGRDECPVNCADHSGDKSGAAGEAADGQEARVPDD